MNEAGSSVGAGRAKASRAKSTRIDQRMKFSWHGVMRDEICPEPQESKGGEEFSRRFLRHVLPRGFVRIRHYGLLANRGREEKLTRCRRLLLGEGARRQAEAARMPVERLCLCAVCGKGEMRVVERVPARPEEAGTGRCREDSS